MEELIIDESNWDQIFKDHFFDIRRNAPKRGQVMACYTAVAELVEGELKKDLIHLLSMTAKVNECVTLLKKMGCAEEKDAIRICREIAEDLQAGKTAQEISAKVYEYVLKAFYYTESKYVPTSDPHWSCIEIKNLDEFIERSEKTKEGTITSRIIMDEEKKDEESI